MRRLVAILALAIASILVIDIAAPAFIRLEPGSVGVEHRQELAFTTPVSFMAPTDEDCS